MPEIDFTFRDARPTLRPIPTLLLPQLYLAVLLALRLPTSLRIPLAVPYLYALYHAVAHFSCHHAIADYLVGTIAAFQACNVLPLAVFDEMMFWERDGKRRMIAEEPFVKRVWLYLGILFNPRGIGWSTQIPNIPPPSSLSPWRFVLSRTLVAAFWIGVLVMNDFLHHDVRSWATIRVPRVLPVVRTVDTLASYFTVVAFFKLVSVIPSILCVATGLFAPNPRDWPDAFGEIGEMYTFRRFWGRYWHQNIRRYVVPFASLVASTLHLPRGTLLSAHVQTLAVFGLSGVMHAGGDTMMLGPRFAGASLPGFLRIAAALVFEDTVLAYAAPLVGEKRRAWWRAAGYVWVAALLAWGRLGFFTEAYQVESRRWGWVEVVRNFWDLRW